MLVVMPMLAAAMPPRGHRPPAVRLAPGQWLRWQLNYRHTAMSGERDWSYQLATLNLSYGAAARDTFLGAPDHHVDERGRLR